MLNFPYFSLDVIFFTSPIEVPVITTNILFPIEYNNKSNTPKNKFPLCPTIASRTTNIGVEQGDEKTPANIPVKKAPIYPFLVFFVFKYVGFINVNISKV